MEDQPRPEYPRSQFRRERWIQLNGEWSFAFDDDDVGLRKCWQHATPEALRDGGSSFDRRITVPFCYQAELSSIGDTSFHDVVWYARAFDPPSLGDDECLLLHFGAVDYRATVWVNGIQVIFHEGGHTPFSADVTDALGESDNVLVVRAEDPSRDATIPRGKQYWREKSEGIFYTRTTGVWQTVWMEPVNRRRMDSLRLTPDVDAARIDAEVEIAGFEPGLSLRFVVTLEGERVLDDHAKLRSSFVERSLPLLARGVAPDTPHIGDWPRPALWSPEEPNLYDLRLELLDADGNVLDSVESYFGMRKVEARDGKVFLNDRPYYQRLVLDQGYFPGGLLTAPTDEDLKRDIELAKEMGFNGARKHQKVEDPRWLYWADRLGFLVWGEMAAQTQTKDGRDWRRVAKTILTYGALFLLTLLFIAPLLWMLSTSFKTSAETTQLPLSWIPRDFSTEGYQTIMGANSQSPVLRWFLNSMIAATANTLLILVTASMAAYALARMEFRGKNIMFAVIIATLFIPAFLFLMPNFMIVQSLGWLNTLLAVIVPGAASAFGVFFLRQFFLSMPKELEEAALIDGANRFQIFTRIILPLSKAPLATLAVLSFLTNWNDFLWPVYVLFTPESLTLPPGLSILQSAYTTDYAVIMAGGVIASIPVLIIFFIAQRYIIQGVSRSGLKG